MVPTTPLKKSLILVSIGRLFTEMSMIWSHGVTLVNVKAKSSNVMRCLKMQFKFMGPFPSSQGNKFLKSLFARFGTPRAIISDREMGLLDFVNYADTFKVKIGERTLAANEVSLITETEDRVISPSPQTISLVDHTIQDELNVNVGKRKKRVTFVSGSPPVKMAQNEGSGQADIGYGSVAPATEDATSSSVTPTPERASEGDFCDNVRTRPPSVRFVVLSSSSADTNIPTSPQVVSLVSSAQTGVNVPVTEPASDGRTSSVIELEAAALSATPSQSSLLMTSTNNHVTCGNLLDHVTPPGYWVALRNQHDARFLNSFNINSAQYVCMVFELHLCYEHEIMTREKYEKKFTDSVVVVQQRDAKIVDLKAQLEKSEAEAAEVVELRRL
ncbi:hypothetical protein Tco_0671466 [Tanacetum coccineum]